MKTPLVVLVGLALVLAVAAPSSLGCAPHRSYVPREVGGQQASPDDAYAESDEEHGDYDGYYGVQADVGGSASPSYDTPLSDTSAEPPAGYAASQSIPTSESARVHQYVPAAPPAPGLPPAQLGTEQYAYTPESGFKRAFDEPLSTFSVDVDTASYSNVRRFLTYGQRPPIDAVRIEELVNYFDYEYPSPRGEHPISITTEVADCPWNSHAKLVQVGLRAGERERADSPPRNLVFLIDVSGSMNAHNKLPLLVSAMKMLVDQLNEDDSVAIVTYAGSSGVALEPTTDRGEMLRALDRLQAGGSTHGSSGIRLAYHMADATRQRGSINRVILATDGDFNVGITDRGSLGRLIEQERERGVFLTVLGFGMGNLKDATMETLADKGNGNYAYIDTLREAQKVLVDEIGSTLRTVAKDTKIQVELNPAHVERYRLVGYENRRLAAKDFNDDRKDAGDMGDGHTVTAIYEVELKGGPRARPGVDPLKYQDERPLAPAAQSGELMTIKVRYKHPEAHVSRLLSTVVHDSSHTLEEASEDLRFASAVAAFGLLLRDSQYAGLHISDVEALARTAIGRDRYGYRREFLELLAAARSVLPQPIAMD